MKLIFKGQDLFTGAAPKPSPVRTLVISALAICAASGVAVAQQRPLRPSATKPLKACHAIVSFEGRIVIEQWARPKNCKKPIRTRVTDRFLGFSCLESDPQSVSCRPFVPPPASRAFHTSRFFRCFDLAVVDTETGFVITRMREWTSPSKKCHWSKSMYVAAMEVDFATREVCVGALCMSVGRLSPIGQLRLRHLIGKALRDLDMISGAKMTQGVYHT